MPNPNPNQVLDVEEESPLGKSLLGGNNGSPIDPDSLPRPKHSIDASSRRQALFEGAMSSTISHPNVVRAFEFNLVRRNNSIVGQRSRSSTASAAQPGAAASEDIDIHTSHGIGSAERAHQVNIIMEYCDRGSLETAIEEKAFLDPLTGAVDMRLVVLTLSEVAAAMSCLHQNNIAHRDLKPKNGESTREPHL